MAALNGTPNGKMSQDPDRLIASVLKLIRQRFGLDVSFIAQVKDGRRTLRFVDADDEFVAHVGDSDPVDDTYCGKILEGSLPEFIRDPSQYPVLTALPATAGIPVGTHLSVPIRFGDGQVYGTLCSFGYEVHDELTERDLELLHILATMIAGSVEDAEAQRQAKEQRAAELFDLQVDRDLFMVFQPIVELATHSTVGVEALARFPGLGTGPAEVFAAAWSHDNGMDLELRAAEAALRYVERLPDDQYMAINLAPATVGSDRFLELVKQIGQESSLKTVVEITEHAAVEDYLALEESREKLRDRGVRFAIDDVGTGYSGLEHMLRIEPDILKLDGALIEAIDTSPNKQAMVAALQTYAGRIDTRLIAERVETLAEHDTLRILGLSYGQGYYFAKPGPFEELHRTPALV